MVINSFQERIFSFIPQLSRNGVGAEGEVWKIQRQVLFQHDSWQQLSLPHSVCLSAEFGSKSIIVPIYNKGDADSPGNYRGVSLLSVVCKIFTYILNKRLTEWTENGNKLSEKRISEPAIQQQTTLRRKGKSMHMCGHFSQAFHF